MKSLLLVGILATANRGSFTTWAFAPPSSSRSLSLPSAACPAAISSQGTGTLLKAAVMPPFIISGIMKKMREEKEKKKIPLSRDEASAEAPGLRVGRQAWKWPAIWPYDANFFMPAAQAAEMKRKASMSTMTSILSGGTATTPIPEEAEQSGTGTSFDALNFWSEQEPVQMDPEAAAKLTSHFEYYLKDGMSVLELGAGRDSYLGKNLKLSRHVGVSASMSAMEGNPSLTERLVVDLNKVVEERDVASDDLRRLATEPFDAVVMTNVIPYLTSPREVYRSAWYLLKPGGCMIVAFSGKEASKEWYPDAQTVMWKQYNDDQHMWISGSFFEFSASSGWENLLGFDISPDSAKELDRGDGNPLSNLMNSGKANNIFVVQATKASKLVDSIDPEDVENSVNSLTWMLPIVESRDKSLVVPRLARVYQITNDEAIRKAIERNIPLLPNLYEILFLMDQFAFTFSMQAQLACDLLSDPDFSASEAQLQALREGLGLKTPGADFWLPVGQQTAAMQIDDKISLLAYIVPRFGSGKPEQEQSLQSFVTGLSPTFAVIRSKCPGMPESDVQLLGTELLAVEVLTIGRCSREEFGTWMGLLTRQEFESMLAKRKQYNTRAKEELAQYKVEKAELERKREDYKKRMEEQIATARRERSMIFNPRTQKMEIFDNPKNKKKWFQ
jgi:SAM-dependent methyltransferase